VQRLQRARDAREEGDAGPRVREGVHGGCERVEGEAPVGEGCEVAEVGSCLDARPVRAVPGGDEDEGGEGIEGLERRDGGASQWPWPVAVDR
jgi:hypothetical protein